MSIADDVAVRAQLYAGPRGGLRQRPRERPHASDRHIPQAGAVTDHVIEKAPVLAESWIPGRGERPDRGVCQYHAAQQVGFEAALEQPAQRLLDQGRPERVVIDQPAELVTGGQRLRQRAGHPRRDPTQPCVERLPARERARVPGQSPQRSVGELRRVADQQAAVGVGRIRRDRASAQLDSSPSSRRSSRREQADQVRVAGDARVDAGPQPLRDRGAAELRGALEHQHRAAGAGEQDRGDQAVVATAHDHGVAPGGRGSRPCAQAALQPDQRSTAITTSAPSGRCSR